MKKLFKALITMSVLMTLGACAKTEKSNEANDGIKVVTTFYPVYDFTTKIVGDNGEVSMLVTGEVEPHDYEPSAKDIAKIQSADVFVYSSNEMETWVSSVLANIDTKKTKVIEASAGIELLANEEGDEHDHEADEHDHEADEHDEHDGHDHEAETPEHDEEEAEDHAGHNHELDPHVWLSPLLAEQQAKNILSGITEIDAPNKTNYEKNYNQFVEKLTNLDGEFKEAFKDAQNKTFVTQHAAFGYLANEYGLHQVSISGLTPDVEPSPKQLAALQDFVKEEQVKYIYIEQSGSSKYADTIAKATGAEILTLSTLETVSTKDVKAGEDYFSIMENNLEALKKSIK
ncbi:metal ABC transporter substrate-binding protein [Vagococcus zengguangii]|uniref:Zinc ABC transporter substrate-binding protein n=1 Tax=Vagococcus zengguangii TaxID=2571750 RepID=A0A4D7CQT4_9ENTE|nr:metal ABC transporter substrate-binding protein [Vagococcus zengguangii]QCI86525.1 zinc ABC transporter substrate-binding protein [Vagococcus zengguangii]TLG81225.1 zinc ABC transporter substrate-binding protein [Vagococcus zengguangii]